MLVNEQQTERALDRIETSLTEYLWIMERVRSCDVSADTAFQEAYDTHYRVRKDAVWRGHYYSLMERAKAVPISFRMIVGLMQVFGDTIEAALCSKLVATVDPSKPILDKTIMRVFGMDDPVNKFRSAIVLVPQQYEDLEQRYSELLASPEGRRMCDQFSKRYPNAAVTDIKRIDFVLRHHSE